MQNRNRTVKKKESCVVRTQHTHRQQQQNDKNTSIMKHTIILISVLLTACLAHAQQIPTEFLGLKMGKTTLAEAIAILEKQGFTPYGNELGGLVLKEKVTIEGIEADGAFINFDGEDGGLALFGLMDSCASDNDAKCQKLVATFQSKYQKLKDIPEALIALLSESGLDMTFGKVDLETNTLIYTTANDNGLIMVAYHYNKKACSYVRGLFDPANEVTSVSGCKFGDSRSNVSQHLRRRFGAPIKDDDYNMSFANVEIGGTLYDAAFFYFKRNPKTARVEFVSAEFQKQFFITDEEEAKALYGNLVSQYGKKYTNIISDVTDDGMLYSACGSSKEYPLPILISVGKSLSRGGDMYYYVTVDYFPEAIKDLYDDDI